MTDTNTNEKVDDEEHINRIMKHIKDEENKKEIAYVSDFIKMNANLDLYNKTLDPFIEQLNERVNIMNQVSDYLNKDRNSTLSTLDHKIVDDFISMGVSLDLYNNTFNPFIKQLNESGSIVYNVNAWLDEYNANKLNLFENKLNLFENKIIDYFRETNIKSIKSFNLYNKRQRDLSDKMKLQSREIHRLLRNEFSNIPEPRFLPRIQLGEGKKLFKYGFNNLKDNMPNPSGLFNNNNKGTTNENWRNWGKL